MAGFSSSSNGVQETSSHPPLLTIKKLMPRRLPPIGIEGPKTTVDQPPPPPPSPTPWSWYHRNCTHSPRSRSDSPKPRPLTPTTLHRRYHCKSVKPLSNINRYMDQQNDLKKCSRSASLKDSTDDLWSLYSFLNGRTHLLVDYAVHFLPPSEIEALVQTLQHHSIHCGDSSAQSTARIESQLHEEEYYKPAAFSSERSTWTESELSIRSPFESDDPVENTGSSEFETDSGHSSRQPKCNDRTSFHSQTPSTHLPPPSVTPIIDPIIPLPRRLPVPDRPDSMLTPPIFHPHSVSTTTGARTPLLRRLPVPQVKDDHNATSSVAARSVAIHRKLPKARVYVNPLGPDSPAQGFAGRRILQHQHAFEYNTQPSHLAPITSDDAIVIEMWIRNARTHEELLLLRKLPKLVSDVTKYKSMYQSLLQQSKMSEFLLHVAQAIFEEMVSLDQLIKKILEVAQRLVSADRASLFLVDHRNFELVSTVFDLQYESNNDSDFSKKEIRIPINKGIAGHVAMSGETMNIPDAYSDDRFNKAVDEATGYRTVSILCMPIKVRGKVIAVVQMVNKRDKEAFGNDDEAAFQVFSTFFGLSLHHARLYDKIKRKEQKYKVALEVLGYHNTCAEEDVTNLLEDREKEERINYNDFALNPFEVDDVEKCKGILTMFDDLFDVSKFDVPVLARFVLTVKKNYRKVPYHNFDHGWAVANSMYVMLKHDTDNRFDYNNRLALFIACLCHDLDHRGYTNKFMSEIASPLATIYTTSTLEHHHFNMTVTILQQDGHNIFNHMSSEGYKDMLDSIRQCILATDLATLFPNLKKINELVFDTPQFDWNDVNHRALSKSFAMTCADLCAAAKPFEVQLVTAEIITAEFYQQGDLERQAGRTPVPMMDRSRPEELPACQVGFLSQICLPCYTVLSKLFPTTEPMLAMTKQNLDIWKTRASEIERKNKNN